MSKNLPWISEKLTYQQCCNELHRIIDGEYSIERLFSSDIDHDQTLIEILVNINPSDVFSEDAVNYLADLFCTDRVFMERWGSIAIRFQIFLAANDIDHKELSKWLRSEVDVINGSISTDLIPHAAFAPRTHMHNQANAVVNNRELFWIPCIMICRLTLSESPIMQRFMSASDTNKQKKVTREARVSIAAKAAK